MGSNAKLLLLALFGVVLFANSGSVHASKIEATAYRGSAGGNAVGAAQQHQPLQTAAAQSALSAAAAAAAAGRSKVVTAAYRDKPSLKDFYYGKKNDEYDLTGGLGNPGYNSQYPNPTYPAAPTTGYATPAYPTQQAAAFTQQPQQPQQPQQFAATTYFTAPQQPQYSYQQYQPAPYPKPTYPQQPYGAKDDYNQAPQYQYGYPQPYQPVYDQQPEGYGGYTPAPAPAPAPYMQKPVYYPPPAPYQPPYYAPAPYGGGDKTGYDKSGKGYYPKPAPASICQSETFGAFYTQAYDDYISADHELSGVVSAFMGCKDRLTLGGMCSYTCYDGEYIERFVGTTTRIVTSPPQDWDNVDPWDHPVYCAWDLGHISAKSLPPPPKVSQTGYNFSCDFTIKAICCDDVVPYVPYGGDVDLGDGSGGGGGGGGGGCGGDAGGCGDGGGDCTGGGCGGDCTGPDCNAGGNQAGNKKSGKFSTANSGKRSSRVRRASMLDVNDYKAGFMSIGNSKVTGGVRTPKKNAHTSMQAKSKAQPAQLTPTAAQAALTQITAQQPILKASTASTTSTTTSTPMKLPLKIKTASVDSAAVAGAGALLHEGEAMHMTRPTPEESQDV